MNDSTGPEPGVADKPCRAERIVLFTLDSLPSGVALHELVAALEGRVVAIVASRRYGGKYGSFVHQAVKNARRGGWSFLNYLSLEMVWYHPMAEVAHLVNRLRGRMDRVVRLRRLARRHRIPVIATREPNAAEVCERLRRLEPDLFVSFHFDHVICAPLRDIPRCGTINVHPGLLPDLRGPFPVLWAMIRAHEVIGVTVHGIDSDALDAGPVLLQKIVPFDPAEPVQAIHCRLARAGAALAADAIGGMEAGTLFPVSQPEEGAYDAYPRREDIALLQDRGGRLASLRQFARQFF